MGIWIYLSITQVILPPSDDVYILEDGVTKRISRAEYEVLYRQSCDPYIVNPTLDNYVYERNVTNNYVQIASEVGLFYPIWRPVEVGIKKANQLIPLLEEGLTLLFTPPLDKFRELEPSMGWGTYEHFTEFIQEYLAACKEYPNTEVCAS